MANPFEKRATEYLRDDEAFLAVVSPEPLATFFQKHAEDGLLYDRLSIITGTPGSGKTTLARLFQFRTLHALLDNRTIASYRPVLDALASCGAVTAGDPALIGGRIPLESEYRDLWEFPYPDRFKTGLMIRLLQARSVLSWFQHLQESDTPADDVEIIPRANANAAITAIGGTAGQTVLDRARDVEMAIYELSAALVPWKLENIDPRATRAYDPFDVIERIRIRYHEKTLDLRPLIIFDDAHSLHPDQFTELLRWLSKREIRVSRWVLTRLDALSPREVLLYRGRSKESVTLANSRDRTVIRMQNRGNKPWRPRAFRAMAKDMANRYLSKMEVFSRRSLHSLGDLLPAGAVDLSAGKHQQLQSRVSNLQRRYGISSGQRSRLEHLIADTLATYSDSVRLGVLSILFERHAKRAQMNLFAHEKDESNRPLNIDASVADGARIHLLHTYDLPYYFGIDTLCDASSENAEQFLQLAAQLVSHSETQIILGNSPTITSGTQHNLLRQRAKSIVEEWNFPQCQLVRRLSDGIAKECLTKSLEGNASLGGGAGGFGVPQEEFTAIPESSEDLARVLQYGVAYNAFVLLPEHLTKGRVWCVIELGGVLRLYHGLTLRRGGFLEREVRDLKRLLEDT